MNNKIKVKLRNIKGNILTIGFSPENKLLKLLEKNNKIKEFNTLTNKGMKKGKRKLFGGKKVKIKNIKKKYKNVDYTFMEYSSVKIFFNHLIKNTIDLTREEIFMVIDENLDDYDEIIYRFKRYGCAVEVIDNVIIINTHNIKTKLYKNIIFSIRDFFYMLCENISFVLIGS
jgi:hypothetical protein